MGVNFYHFIGDRFPHTIPGEGHSGDYYVNTSPEAVYDVLTVAEHGNALMMLVRGVRTADEAKKYLADRNAEHLIVDNSILVNNLRERELNPSKALLATSNIDSLVRNRKYADLRNSPYIIDAVEMLCDDNILNLSTSEYLLVKVLNGSLNWNAFKSIDLGKAITTHGVWHVPEYLQKYSPEEMSTVIDFIEAGTPGAFNYSSSWQIFEYVEMEILKLGSLSSYFKALNEYQTALFKAVSDSQRREILLRAFYHARLLEALNKEQYIRDHLVAEMREPAKKLFKAEVPVEVAARCLKEGMSVQQAIGVAHGITNSVAEGWL